MTTVAAGQSVTLLAEWRQYAGGPMVDVDNVTISITYVPTAQVILAATAVGVTNPATGFNGYTWSTSSSLPEGDYLVVWAGTDPQLDPVTASELVQVTEAPSTSIASLAKLKAEMQIATIDATRDERLQLALDAATEWIREMTGRHWRTPTGVAETRTYETAGRVAGDLLLIDPIADLTGLAVSSGGPADFTALTTDTYQAGDLNAIARGGAVDSLRTLGLPWAVSPYVQVTARFDWLPVSLEKACLLLAQRLYKRASSPEGVAGSSEWGVIRVTRADPDVLALIGPFSVPGFA